MGIALCIVPNKYAELLGVSGLDQTFSRPRSPLCGPASENGSADTKMKLKLEDMRSRERII
jgi:hypothetical protein